MDIEAELRKGIRWLAIATICLYLVLAGLVVFVWSNQRVTTDSLCTFRSGIEQRVAEGQKFLIEHPNGVNGIPASTIKNSLTNQQVTLKALKKLKC